MTIFNNIKTNNPVIDTFLSTIVLTFIGYVLNSLNEKFYNEKREKILQEFLQEFVSLNLEWKKEWLSFFEELLKKEF